jgi:CBS domain containing-hemolysin-like protein
VSTAASAAERAAADKIAAELGVLIGKIAPETFAAARALRGARIAAPGKPLRVPAATRAAWHRRLDEIDRVSASVARVRGADAARGAALHALVLLRASCRAGELALSSATATKREHYAKQQQADEARLHAAIQALTAALHRAGATRL